MTALVGPKAKAIRLTVRLTPKGGRDAIEGWVQDAAGKRMLKARVAAPPEDGKANRALIELIADALDVAKSRVAIVSGEAARLKVVEIAGDADALAARAGNLGTKC
ncbi:MAG TPA: DUF167 family protein [Micropepsaceae bacterium]|nr:DUF167 family protein [Micropepsaceae bacterium]